MDDTRVSHRLREYEVRTAKWNARTAMFGALTRALALVAWVLLAGLLVALVSNPYSPALTVLAQLAKMMK